MTQTTEQTGRVPPRPDEWPALAYDHWAPTKKTLHMCAQMLGKIHLALAPPQPEWVHAALHLDGRGFTTGPMPWGTSTLTARIDVFEPAIWMQVSDGRDAAVPLGPDRTIADIWTDLRGALATLGIQLDVWEKPQEVVDTTQLSRNRHDHTFVPAHAQRFYQVLSAVDGAFDEFRSTFFGRSAIQLWWGGLDLSLLLSTGKRQPPPDDRGYIMRYDADVEHMTAGFWPGDDNIRQAMFFAYVSPRPSGCELATIEPQPAGWVEAMAEWVLPYDAVRNSVNPRRAILDFLGSVYRVAVTNGGWDEEALRYSPPPPPKHN